MFTITAGFAAALFIAPLGHSADKKLGVRSASSSPEGLRPPVLGFLAEDDSPVLRPVIGGPGAAVLGDSILLNESIKRISSSPAGTFLLAEITDGGPISVIATGEDVSLRPIAGAFARWDIVEYSPSGNTAALFSASLARIQVITGLPDAPSVAGQYDVSSLPGPVLSLDINDAGSLLLAGASDGQNGGVFRITADQIPSKLMAVNRPSAVRIVPESDAALVADSELHQLSLVSGVSETPAPALLAGPDDIADGPNQIELLDGGRTAVVACVNSSELLVVDLRKAKISRVALNAPAAALHPVRARAGVVVSTATPPARWFLSGGNTPVLSFIADITALVDQQ